MLGCNWLSKGIQGITRHRECDLLPTCDSKPINFVSQRMRQLMFALPQVIISTRFSQKYEYFQMILNPLVVIRESRF